MTAIRECCICHRVLNRAPDTRRHLKEAHAWLWPSNVPLPSTIPQLQKLGRRVPEAERRTTPAGAKRLSILNHYQPGRDRTVREAPSPGRELELEVTFAPDPEEIRDQPSQMAPAEDWEAEIAFWEEYQKYECDQPETFLAEDWEAEIRQSELEHETREGDVWTGQEPTEPEKNNRP